MGIKRYDRKYRELYKKEQRQYAIATGMLGNNINDQNIKDHEYAFFLKLKAERLEYRSKHKKIPRKGKIKKVLALQ